MGFVNSYLFPTNNQMRLSARRNFIKLTKGRAILILIFFKEAEQLVCNLENYMKQISGVYYEAVTLGDSNNCRHFVDE